MKEYQLKQHNKPLYILHWVALKVSFIVEICRAWYVFIKNVPNIATLLPYINLNNKLKQILVLFIAWI